MGWQDAPIVNQPVPDSRLPVVPTSDTADLQRDGWTRGPDGKVIWASDQPSDQPAWMQAPIEEENYSTPVQTVDVPPSDAPASVEQFGEQAVNRAAGLGRGAAGLVDTLYKGVGAIGDLGDWAVSAASDAVLPEEMTAQIRRGRGMLGKNPDGSPQMRMGLTDVINRYLPAQKGEGAANFISEIAGGALNVPGLTAMPNSLNALMPNVPQKVGGLLTEGQKVYSAASRLGDDVKNALLPADVGGVGTRMATGASAMTLGGIPIAEGAQKSINALAGARDATAKMAGSVMDSGRAGEAAQKGARQWMKTTEGRGGQLFEAVPVPGKKLVELGDTRQALKELTAEMESNPKLSAMFPHARLKGYLDALTPEDVMKTVGPKSAWDDGVFLGADFAKLQKKVPSGEKAGGQLSWEDMNHFRSIIGEIVGQPGLAEDTSTKSLRKLYGALSSDMEKTATAQGPKALQAWRRANQYWRGRAARIEGTLSTILGKDLNKGGQPAFEGLERLANLQGGDAIKLSRLMRSLPKDEANTVRASLIQRMGQARKGAQDAEGEVFSPAEFVTRWNGMSKDAKSSLFHEPELRSALNDLVTVAAGMKAAAKYANTSKTGLAVNGIALISSAFTSPVGTAVVAGTQLGAGKLLSSRWLVRSLVGVGKARTVPQAKAAIGRLSVVASREPAIANEVTQLQQQLMNALNDNGLRSAAAEEQEQK